MAYGWLEKVHGYSLIMIRLLAFFLFIILCLIPSCNKQIAGCTDPLANNYMSAANVNDGSCMYDLSSVTPLASFQLGESLSETSGLIIWEGLGWTHNDNTDTRLYGLDLSDARIEENINLPGVENLDWEEISQDSSFIYVGDFGNNEFYYGYHRAFCYWSLSCFSSS